MLVVDDEPLIRWSVSETLADLGMDVEQAFDGASAIQCASKAKAYDVILLDLRLPDVNDLSLLARLRVMAPNAMVILMTAFGTPEVTEEALRLGAFKVVYKPFELRDIAELVTTTRAAGH